MANDGILTAFQLVSSLSVQLEWKTTDEIGTGGTIKCALTRRFQRCVVRFYRLKTRNNRFEKPQTTIFHGTEGVGMYLGVSTTIFIPNNHHLYTCK